MFTVKLRQNLEKLSYNENLIANYLLANRASISSMTSYEIAKNAQVAQTSVIRFAKKIGYASFKDLQIDLLMDEENENDSGHINPKENSVETIGKLQKAYESTLKEVLRFNAIENLETIVNVIYNAEKILCFGAETSTVIAKLFSDHIQEIGKESLCSVTNFDCIGYLRNMKKTDVLFLVSASGETQDTIQIARAAERYGIKIVALTGSHESTLKSIADYSLISSDYKVYTNMLNITNRCSQMFLVETLFLLMWKKDPDRFEKNVQGINYDLDSVAGWPMKRSSSEKKRKGRKNESGEKRYI